MLSLLLEAALRSLLLGATVWFGLKMLRVRDPRVQMTAWIVVLFASLTMPAMMRWAVVTVPSASPPVRFVQLIEATPSSLFAPIAVPAEAVQTSAAPPTGLESQDVAVVPITIARAIDWLVIATSVYVAVAGILLLRLLIGIALTRRLARAARPIGDGWASNVRVSDVVGVPVTFGTTILLPPECMQWNLAKRLAVLSHERAHVRHGDFYVLLLAALNRAIFWFSPFAWWQLTRLAELAEMISDDAAIEVLADRPSYANILLDLAGDVRRAPAGLAMARAVTVRQRVERILAARGLPAPTSWRKQVLAAAALVPLVAICAATIAKGTIAQNAPPPTTRTDGAVIADALDAYVGSYQLNPLHVLTITREGSRLFARQTGGPKFELLMQGAQGFASPDGSAFVAFISDGDEERASGLTLREAALADRHGKRVDAATAKAVEDVFARRIAAAPDRFRDQAPAPGGRAAVLKMIEELQHGTSGYAHMSATLAERTRRHMPELAAMMTALGAVESTFFRGVGPGGYDIYGAKFAHGFAEFRLLMGPDGITEDVIFRPDGNETPGGLAACAREPTLRSVPGSAPIKLLLYNTTGAEIQLFELDGDGKRVRRASVGDNRTSPIMTYIARPWVVADADGQCLEIVMPGQRTRFVTLRPVQPDEDLNRAPSRRSAPMPGSEDALRQYIEAMARGEPSYDRMTPEVAAASRDQLALNHAILAKLGALRAMSFRGVTPLDNDIYMVYFAGGSAEWRIGLTQDGKIGRLALGPQY
jgi:beta-lactamase regulating signal transducer with metallopeptidase domain